MRKYRHKRTGIIATKISTHPRYKLDDIYDGPSVDGRLIEDSNDWELITELEYFKCTISGGELVHGRVYKVVNKDDSTMLLSYNGVNLKNRWYNQRFILSSKEEYDKQFEPKKDYEVLVLKNKLGNVCEYDKADRVYTEPLCNVYRTREEWVNTFTKNNIWSIHSVKRLSDG